MKAKIDTRVSFSKNNFIIRPMAKGEIAQYAILMGKTIEERDGIRRKMKKRLEQRKDDDTDYIFSVLYDGKFYGAVETIATNAIGTKANAHFYLPEGDEFEELNTEVVRYFIEMCKETGVYDEKVGIVAVEDGQLKAYIVSI